MERYRTQLMRLSRALREKRPQYEQRHEKVILQHDSKDELFYRNGIRALPERWAKVVANDEQYFE